MFHVQDPVAALDVDARARVYREYIERHRELQDIQVGPHSDMIILATDEKTGAQTALLYATGTPGALVQFPPHRHGDGELQTCLEGTYGELLPADQCVDDVFAWGETLATFQARHPGVITLAGSSDAGQVLKLGPGASWNFVAGSAHAPCGWIGEHGLLLAQIHWPGPNQLLEAGSPGVPAAAGSPTASATTTAATTTASSSATASASAATTDDAILVPPDAVRVWRGFRLAAEAPSDFFAALGSIFIPVTVQMQRLYGLTAYLPAVLPGEKPAGVPDEIALVFYRTQQAYTDAKQCVGGRAYGLLHSTIFDVKHSPSDFPTLLDGNFHLGKQYHLFRDAADWQRGFTQVFVGAPRAGADAAQFASQIEAFCIAQQDDRPAGLEGAIVAGAEAFVVYWEHWTSSTAAAASRIGQLAELAVPVLFSPYSSTPVVDELDRPYAGLAVSGGECFNTQFTRLASHR